MTRAIEERPNRSILVQMNHAGELRAQHPTSQVYHRIHSHLRRAHLPCSELLLALCCCCIVGCEKQDFARHRLGSRVGHSALVWIVASGVVAAEKSQSTSLIVSHHFLFVSWAACQAIGHYPEPLQHPPFVVVPQSTIR